MEYLAALVGQATTQEMQRRQRLWFGAGDLALGAVLFPLLAAFAPGGTFLTALTMRTTDLWQAGAALLQAADPAGSTALVTVTRFYNANNEALQTCAEAARKAGKEQRCTVSGAVPER